MRQTQRIGKQAVAKMLAAMCNGEDASCPAEDKNANCPFQGMPCADVDAARWLEAMKSPGTKYAFGDKVTVDGKRAVFLFHEDGEDESEIIFEDQCISDTVPDEIIKEGW